MKKLIILSMIFASQFSFAQVLTHNEGQVVIKAVVDSIKAGKLECLDSLKPDAKTYAASRMNWDVLILTDEELAVDAIKYETKMIVSINETGQQPIISITRSYREAGLHEEIVSFTTNPAITEIVSFEFMFSSLVKEMKNVGTLIKPVYKEVITRTAKEKSVCR